MRRRIMQTLRPGRLNGDGYVFGFCRPTVGKWLRGTVGELAIGTATSTRGGTPLGHMKALAWYFLRTPYVARSRKGPWNTVSCWETRPIKRDSQRHRFQLKR